MSKRAEEWAKRHEKVEDVIFDGPVCRTCRLIDGAAVPYPCDAALILAYATEQVAQTRAERAMQIIDWESDGRVVRDCLGCQPFYYSKKMLHNVFAPRHKASERCKSGKRPHCICDACF